MNTFQKVLEGMMILAKYGGDNICAEHDEIWAGDDASLSPEDEARMDELGWSKASEGGWHRFV